MKRLIITITFTTVIIGVVLLILLILALNAIADFIEPQENWTLKDLNTMFDVPVPSAALNININGYRSRGYSYLDLSFVASEAEALKFASQFCNGVLNTGYDPFNTVDSKTLVPKSFLITLNGSISGSGVLYYSFSPYAATTVIGNRCLDGGAPTNIKVDKTNPFLTEVRLYIFPACGDGCTYEAHYQKLTEVP